MDMETGRTNGDSNLDPAPTGGNTNPDPTPTDFNADPTRADSDPDPTIDPISDPDPDSDRRRWIHAAQPVRYGDGTRCGAYQWCGRHSLAFRRGCGEPQFDQPTVAVHLSAG